MIRNVKDNAKQDNPYTTNTSNIRMGKFYSNRIEDKPAKTITEKIDDLRSNLSEITEHLHH